jgi:hypothetical protein
MNTSSNNRSNADETTSYENKPITRRGELLNLTQMWIANNRPKNHQPHEWLRLPSTERFSQRLQSVTGLSRNALLVADRGGQPGAKGSTWAHWQLALVYAHYLDADFYIWCNELVHNAMQRFGGPHAQPASPMVTLLEEAFGHLHRRLDMLGQYACDNLLLTAAVQQLPGKRLEFTTRTRSIICAVVAAAPFEDQCSCCSRRPVLSPAGKPFNGAEFDHFYGASLNRPEYGWLICRQCHDDFTNGSPLLRLGHIPVFHVFQGHVLDYLVNHRSAVTSDP